MPSSIALNCDCMEGMRSLPDECIDLTVTSPPYDELRDYNGFSFDWKATIEQLARITKTGGVVVWIVNDQTVNGSETGTSFKQALYAMEMGFNLHDTMIWSKGTTAFPDTNRYYPSFEYMFIFSRGTPKTVHLLKDKPNAWAGTKVHGTRRQKDGTLRKIINDEADKVYSEYGIRLNIWDIPGARGNFTGHPAVFPMAIPTDHIRTWSNEGDTVLDPFLGSGTTRIAAYDLNRDFIGYEISKEYFAKQEERFEQHTAQGNLFLLDARI